MSSVKAKVISKFMVTGENNSSAAADMADRGQRADLNLKL